MDHRLKYAMAGYLVIALAAAFTLDGKMRIFVWLLLAALAVKSWVASRQSN